MAKRIGWEGRLIAYLQSAQVQDCAMFFAGAVTVIRDDGTDYGKEWRGKYKTIERGKAMVRKQGFADHVDYVASRLPVLDGPWMAQRGDGAAVLDPDGNTALGIVQGEKIYVMGVAGLALVPLTMAIKAFEI